MNCLSSIIQLGQPGMLSAIGSGVAAHLDALLYGRERIFLSPNSQWVQGKTRYFGAVNTRLRDFSDDLPEAHRSRNNQLLWHALAEIEPQIQAAIERFGSGRVAVVMGTSTSGVDENLPLFQSVAQDGSWYQYRFKHQQQVLSAPADFVRHVYGLGNAAYGISTACTSGARALMSAARLLRLGVCDAVICGGVDMLSSLTINGFHALEVLSDGIANPFSRHRNGINIGEAAAVFVAQRGEPDSGGIALLGFGASSDAHHMSSPRPDGLGAVQAFENALKNARLSPQEIGWINLHGTGTVLNDSMESRAVAQVFGSHTPCTSTKPFTGHTLGAAGALEAAIVWASISRTHNISGSLPPQRWDGEADSRLPAIALTDEHSRWQTPRRIAASASFAFGGNNSVLILGEI